MVRKATGDNRAVIHALGKDIDLEGEWKEVEFIGGLENKTGKTFPTEF